MLSVSQSALEVFRSVLDGKTSSTDDPDCGYMVSICRSFSEPEDWDLELLFLPIDMPSGSLTKIDGVTFQHPGSIEKLDIVISYENEMFLIDGVRVELT